MKTSIRNKKGFTIVELVIVIAVIAILAAVLIPTFASLVEKANQSADIQAVKQMNTALAIESVDSPITLNELYSVLEDAGMSADNYHPITSDTYYFWDATENMIVYTDSEYKVIYPENAKEFDVKTSKWYSLSGEINEVEVTVGDDGKVDISTAEQLYSLAKLSRDPAENKAITEINIKNDINAMGANIVFGTVANGETLTINGSGYTISNVSCDHYNQASDGSGNFSNGFAATYYCGFVSENNGTLKINQLTFDGILSDMNASLDKPLSGGSSCVSVILGINNGTANFDNVVVKNSIVKGYTKVGVLVGYASKGQCIFTHCSLENNTVVLEADGADPEASYGAVIVGYCTDATVTITDGIKLEGNSAITDESVDLSKYTLTNVDGVDTYTAGSNQYFVVCQTYCKKTTPVKFEAGTNLDKGYLMPVED